MKRNRDEKSDFVEQVLEIEHQIIKQFKKSRFGFGKELRALAEIKMDLIVLLQCN
jgi:uridine kinase